MTATVSQAPHLPALDGARGLACLLVVFFHMGNIGLFYPTRYMGTLGVMLFFALSGFIMTYNYFPGPRRLRYWLGFLVRRFFRIYPVFTFFLLLLVLCVHMGWFPVFKWYENFSLSQVMPHLLLTMGRGALWTIPLEMKFYLCLPLLAGCFWLLRSPRRAFIALLAVWAGLLLYYQLNREVANYSHLHLPAYLSYFLGGMITCFLYRTPAISRLPARFWDAIALIALSVFLLSSDDLLGLIGNHGAWRQTHIFSPLSALAILSISLSHRVKSIFSHPATMFLGRISYSMFLLHTLLILYMHQFKDAMPLWLLFLFSCLLIILASYACYRVIERPMTHYGRKIAKRIE